MCKGDGLRPTRSAHDFEGKTKMQYNRNTYEIAEFKPEPKLRGVLIGVAIVIVGLVVGLVAVWLRGDIEFTGEQQTITFLGSAGIGLIGAGAGWVCRSEYRERD
jgi:hypothetical protein